MKIISPKSQTYYSTAPKVLDTIIQKESYDQKLFNSCRFNHSLVMPTN